MNLQVKNVPSELHERLRRHARSLNCTMSDVVLTAIRHELARHDWRKRHTGRSRVDLGVSAASLLEDVRGTRSQELG